MDKIKIWNNKASSGQIEEIAKKIKEGQLAIIPTDTMYAIIGDALNIKAVERICKLKGINPEKTNLSIICSNISMASDYSKIDNIGFSIMKRLTPGPFTFLFKSASKLPRAFKGRKIVGIRIPDNKFNLELVDQIGSPIITTSIEYEDEDFAKNPDLIAEAYEGKVEMMIEGEEGSTDVSTIIDCTLSDPEIIRQGKGSIG